MQSRSPFAILHDWGHVGWHKPSAQQRPPAIAQSVDCVHFVGQGSASAAFGARQSPVTLALRFGSTLRTDVQQISPIVVLQSELVAQAWGQEFAGVQMPWL